MPSKTAGRSGARSSRSKAGSRGGSRPPRSLAPRRKPARRRNPSVISSAGATVGRGVRAGWLMLAKGAGSTARSVGRARDLEPGHRRDGIALALLGIAVVIAASSWFDAARPVGPVDRHVPSRADRIGRRPVAHRACRDRRGADAHRTRARRAAAAHPRCGDDHAADTRTVASVGGFADGPDRAPARSRIPRLRHRRSAVGGADRVDRRAAAVHRRAVRPAAGDRHDDPRGALDRAADVLRARIPR